MRVSLTQTTASLRNTLIGCLLVFCFEGFQGNQKASYLMQKVAITCYKVGKQPIVDRYNIRLPPMTMI
jgi:hypothetical protein